MDLWKIILVIVIMLGLLWWFRPEYFYLIKDGFCGLLNIC